MPVENDTEVGHTHRDAGIGANFRRNTPFALARDHPGRVTLRARADAVVDVPVVSPGASDALRGQRLDDLSHREKHGRRLTVQAALAHARLLDETE
jgi:hypothetical protein